MDHLIKYKEAVRFLKNPPLLALHPDFAKIRAVCEHFVTGLKQPVCPQSLIHRWAGLVMDPVMYALLKPTTPFTAVVDPGEYAQYNNFAIKAAIKMADKISEYNKITTSPSSTSTGRASAPSLTTVPTNSRCQTCQT